jgi:hypothetical protein
MEVVLDRGDGAVNDGGVEPEQEATKRGRRRDEHDVHGRPAGRDASDRASARLSFRHAQPPQDRPEVSKRRGARSEGGSAVRSHRTTSTPHTAGHLYRPTRKRPWYVSAAERNGRAKRPSETAEQNGGAKRRSKTAEQNGTV